MVACKVTLLCPRCDLQRGFTLSSLIRDHTMNKQCSWLLAVSQYCRAIKFGVAQLVCHASISGVAACPTWRHSLQVGRNVLCDTTCHAKIIGVTAFFATPSQSALPKESDLEISCSLG